MRKWKSLLLGVALPLLMALPAGAQPVTKICLPLTTSASGIAVTSCQDVSATNPIPISGSVSATSSLKATAAAPTYIEGSTDPFSGDLSGNLRVTLTTALPAGASIIGALSANQSVNEAQINGVTTLTGAGVAGTGTQRVSVAQDTTTIAGAAPGTAGTASANVVTVQGVTSMTKLLVTPDSVALPANQSVNVSQINGVTPLMGNGVTGTGSQRVTVASDNTPFPVKIDQTTPDSTNLVSTKPSVATFVSGTATQTSTTSTSLIPLVAAKSIYVMAFSCANTGATASNILFQDGSGGTTLWVTENPAGGGSNGSGGGVPLFKTTAGNALFFAPGTASTTQYCSASGFSQ